MSAELRDLRAKVSAETHCALEAETRVTGRDKSEIVRDILHAWALEQLHRATVIDGLLRAEGMSGIAKGSAGNLREVDGR